MEKQRTLSFNRQNVKKAIRSRYEHFNKNRREIDATVCHRY